VGTIPDFSGRKPLVGGGPSGCKNEQPGSNNSKSHIQLLPFRRFTMILLKVSVQDPSLD